MRIDNGERKDRRLVIAGVFDGMCGEQAGCLLFIPNLPARPPEAARGGLLDGEPVSLSVERVGSGPVYTARVGLAK